MERMSANFFPASEPTPYDGGVYLGKANITIANAIRLNDISVFMNDAGKLSINFPEYPSGDEKKSFVIPKSAEAYAAMCAVVQAARESEQGFAFTPGSYNPQLSVRGSLVEEPHADGRFGIEVGSVCTLVGVSTRKSEYTAEGQKHKYVAVDLPNVIGPDGRPSTYEKEGKTMYNKAFEPCVSKWTDKEGKAQTKDFGQLLNRLVLTKRKQLREAQKEQPSLEEKMDKAKERGQSQNKGKESHDKEPEMSK